MNGGTKTQTTNETQTRAPYAPAIPALQTIIDGGLAAYNSGVGSQVYQGDRTAGLGSTTRSGLDYITQNANGGLGAAQGADAYVGGLLANGGATGATQDAVRGILGVQGVDTSGVAGAASRLSDPNNAASAAGRALTGGQYNLDASGYEALNAGLAGPSQTQRSLQDVADGKYLGGANPYLDEIIGRAQNEAATKVAQTFSANGRYGSGRFVGAQTDAVAGIGAQARYQDYESERQRQAQAAQAIDSGLLARTGASAGLLGAINDTRTGNANQLVTGANMSSQAAQQGLAGEQALAGLRQANNAQQLAQYGSALSAGQADRAAAMAGVGAVPGVQSALLQPGKTLLGVGQTEDASRQLDLAALQDVFNEQQQSPWKQLGLLSELGIPIAGVGGTSTGTTQQKIPTPSLFQQLLGGGLAVAGTASKFGGFGGLSPLSLFGGSSSGLGAGKDSDWV